MTTHNIDIEGLPDGWKPMAYRAATTSEHYLCEGEVIQCADAETSFEYIIVEKIHPRRIVLEYYGESSISYPGEYARDDRGNFTFNDLRNQIDYGSGREIWRQVKECE